MADRIPIATGFKFPLTVFVNVATKTASSTVAGRIVVAVVFMVMFSSVLQYALSQRRGRRKSDLNFLTARLFFSSTHKRALMTMTMNKPQAGGDVYARCSKGSTAGRGAIAGWTPCPLCCASSLVSASSNTQAIHELVSSIPNTTKSLKLFSHGRGLAAHLHAVHTPWKPGEAEVKRRKALLKRQENEKREEISLSSNLLIGIDSACTSPA